MTDQFLAEAGIGVRKERGVIDTGGILKRHKLHRSAGFILDRLAGDPPADHHYKASHPIIHLAGPQRIQSRELSTVQVHGARAVEIILRGRMTR